MGLTSSRNLMLILQLFVASPSLLFLSRQGEFFFCSYVEMDDWKRNQIVVLNSESTEPWQNARADVQIQVSCNISQTNMIVSGLTDKFWDVLNSKQLIYWASNRELISKCLHNCRCLDLSQMWVNVSPSAWNVGCMSLLEQSSVKILNSMLEGIHSYTVDYQPWTTGLGLFYMFLVALSRQL